MTQQYCLASLAAWLSSTGISHHSLLHHICSVCLSALNSSPRPGLAPQSLKSSSQCCAFQGTCVPVRGLYGCGKDCLILIPFRLPQISCFTLRLQCFSSDSDNCPGIGIRRLLPFPHPPRAGPGLLILLFYPWFLCPAEFPMDLYILFHWSGTPVRPQLVLCVHFCV